MNVYARAPSKALPFPLEDPGCRLFSLARQGLFAGVTALGLEPGDELLVPAYHHGSEIEALHRAGIACRFYDARHDSLEPDEEELDGLLGPRTKGLYLIHYLGLLQDAARWRAWCDERGLLLIEDAAQAWLGSRGGVPAGSRGDLAIFCLYKTFGLPDGAAIICKSPLESPPGNQRTGASQTAFRHASFLAQKWSTLAELRRWISGSGGEYDPEKDFAMSSPEAPCLATRFLLPRVVDPAAQSIRAANYGFLLDRLEHMVPRAFAHPPEGSSPFAFPVFSERKKELLGWLDSGGVSALDLWSVPHPSLPKDGFPHASSLRGSVVALPVHQELERRDLERITDMVVYRSKRTTD